MNNKYLIKFLGCITLTLCTSFKLIRSSGENSEDISYTSIINRINYKFELSEEIVVNNSVWDIDTKLEPPLSIDKAITLAFYECQYYGISSDDYRLCHIELRRLVNTQAWAYMIYLELKLERLPDENKKINRRIWFTVLMSGEVVKGTPVGLGVGF